MFTIKKFKAFTLAEVLITIGIIGIVAALTLPTLIGNYRKSVVENKLKSTYSSGPISTKNFSLRPRSISAMRSTVSFALSLV